MINLIINEGEYLLCLNVTIMHRAIANEVTNLIQFREMPLLHFTNSCY